MARDYFDHSIQTAQALTEWLRRHERAEGSIALIAARLADCVRAGGRIIACGNGGSMCDAMHFAEELSGRYRRDRKAIAAQAMGDPAHLTCVANDLGFEQVFARGVEAWGRPGDALVIFSTSGNSRNVVAAAAAARAGGLQVIGLLGRDGGTLGGLCDLSIVVPGETSDRIQEVHIKIAHLVIEEIEHRLFGGG